MHDMAAILGAILRGYALPVRGDHGVVHWARVLENGLRVAEANGADREVVACSRCSTTRGGSTRIRTTATACGAGSSPGRCAAAWFTWTTPGSSCCSRRAG